MNKTIKEKYDSAVDEYLKAFCYKHDLQYDNDCWVANNIGGVAMIGDFFIDFNDIKTDIDYDAPKCEYFKYNDYTQEAFNLGISCPNYSNWLKGCPRSSSEDLERIKSIRKTLDDLIEEENEKVRY